MAQQVEEKKPENDASIPKTMKGLRLVAYDKDMRKALKLEDMDVPVPSDDQVLVKVYSVSLNPVDWKINMGFLSGFVQYNMPCVTGRDFAGVIVGVGKNVKDNKLGDRVCGKLEIKQNDGSFSEYLICKPKDCVKFKDNMTMNIASGIPLVTLTSYRILTRCTNIKEKNKNILILGGSSSTGIAGIQTAKYYGCQNIYVTSSNELLCKKYGATKVYNYKDKDAAKWYDDLDGTVDIIYDCVGSDDSWDNAQNVLNKETGGYFVTIAGKMNVKDAKVEKNALNEKNKYSYFMLNTSDDNGIQDLNELIHDYNLSVEIDEDAPFEWKEDSIYAMFDKSIAHKAHGKLTLKICEEEKK